MPLIECVPNVSEGRRDDIIDALARAIDSRDVHVLDRSSDRSHNRTVCTFAGEAESLQEAVLQLFSAAVEASDLGHRDGVHPRIGAVDVVPFVPLQGATMEQCRRPQRHRPADAAGGLASGFGPATPHPTAGAPRLAPTRSSLLESEIVGLVQADALPNDPRKRLKRKEADTDRVLERRLERNP